MTPDQKAKLETRRSLLIDVLIDEADSTQFATMDTRDGRGDRQWQKTNAIKTATLIMRIEDLIGLRGAGAGSVPTPKAGDDEDDTVGASAGSADVDKLIRDAGEKVARLRGAKKK